MPSINTLSAPKVSKAYASEFLPTFRSEVINQSEGSAPIQMHSHLPYLPKRNVKELLF